jgi:hypothetical protein
LDRLLQLVEQEFEEVKCREIEAVRSRLAGLSKPRLEEYLDEQRSQWAFSATGQLRGSSEEVSGSAGEVLGHGKDADFDRLTLYYPANWSGTERLSLTFSRANGLVAHFHGRRRVWVETLRQVITKEAQLSRPSWHWMYSGGRSYALSFTFNLVVFIASLRMIHLIPATSQLHSAPQAWIAAGISVTSTVALLNVATLDKLLPRFELVPSGEKPTGTRRLRAVGGLLAAAFVGLAAQWLLGL